jgi:hypothetical protein
VTHWKTNLACTIAALAMGLGAPALAQDATGRSGSWSVEGGNEDANAKTIIDFSSIHADRRTRRGIRLPLTIVHVCVTSKTSAAVSSRVRIRYDTGYPGDKPYLEGLNKLPIADKDSGCRYLPLRPGQSLLVYLDGGTGTASGTWGITK